MILTSDNEGVKNAIQVSESCEKIASSVSDSVQKFDKTTVLGGDHSLAIGSLSGHASIHSNLCVIWIDAHTDLNTMESSLSGNMHGMPLSFLIKEMIQNESNKKKIVPSSLFRWIKGSVSASSVAFIGIRDVDDAEKNFLRNLSPSITCFSADDVSKIGAKEVMSRVLDRINPNLTRPIHVSFDIDVLDPIFATSTGTPVDKGITLQDAILMAKIVQETGKLSVLDVVEVNPTLGTSEQIKQTCKSAHDVIINFLGKPRV
jgi:arginase